MHLPFLASWRLGGLGAKRNVIGAACVSIGVSILIGCSHSMPRRDDLVAPRPDLDNARLALGHQVFVANCNQCHPGGSGGEGPALNNKGFVPASLIRFQVRHGMGAMPRFSHQRLSDHELNAVIAYIQALQRERPTLARR